MSYFKVRNTAKIKILNTQESSDNGKERLERSFNGLMRSLPEEFGIKEAVIRFLYAFPGMNGFLTPRQKLEYAAAEAVLQTILSVNPSFVDISNKADNVPALAFARQYLKQDDLQTYLYYVNQLILHPRSFAIVKTSIEAQFRVAEVLG